MSQQFTNNPTNVAQVGGTNVDANSGNKSAGTQRVVIATDQPQLTNALKVDGSAVTQPVSGPEPAAAALADAVSNPSTVLDGACLLAFNGATWDRVRVQSIRKDLSAVAIGTITTVWTPAGGKKIRIMGGMISVSAAASVLFEDNAGGTTVFRTPKLLADTPYNFDLGNGILISTADHVLKATSSASANITGTIWGTEE